MYQLRVEEIDFIRDDIRQRGIRLESLEESLLDHVCCLVEEECGSVEEFHATYQQVIGRFYKSALWEIEDETYRMSFYQNHHIMRKFTIISGISSAIILSAGVLFKFLFLPGASFLVVTGILCCSFVFLPLMLLLKVRESSRLAESLVIFAGVVAGIFFSLFVLFKVMHYPGVKFLGIGTLTSVLCLFVPVYFFTGIRNPATRSNAWFVSAIVVLATALMLVPFKTPRSQAIQDKAATRVFYHSEQILEQNIRRYSLPEGNDGRIFEACSRLKAFLLQHEIGSRSLPTDFESRQLYIGDHHAGRYFDADPVFDKQFNELQELLLARSGFSGTSTIAPDQLTELVRHDKTLTALHTLNQLQLMLVQASGDHTAQR